MTGSKLYDKQCFYDQCGRNFTTFVPEQNFCTNRCGIKNSIQEKQEEADRVIWAKEHRFNTISDDQESVLL